MAAIAQWQLGLSTQARDNWRNLALPPSTPMPPGSWVRALNPSLFPTGTQEQRADLAPALLLTGAAAPGARSQVTEQVICGKAQQLAY